VILLLGGTTEAREIARVLREMGQTVLLTVVTGYGAALAHDDAETHIGALEPATLAALVRTAEMVVDATHPFATVISQIAIAVCAENGVPYLRFERPGSALPPDVLPAATADAAAEAAVRLADGGTIFLTVGSKTLLPYVTAARAAGTPLLARVLPTADVLGACERLGLQPREMLAMQGPTSRELEEALLRHFAAAVLVTKESGSAGGVLDKLDAAHAVGIPTVVVSRPRLAYPRVVGTVVEVLDYLRHSGAEKQ